MLQVCCLTLCWCYMIMIFGVSAEHKHIGGSTESPLLFKQNDYKLKFDRVEGVRYNERYLKYFNAYTYKYNRTTPVVNASLMFNLDPGNDIEAILQTYRFASNEYRIFPIRFQLNLCAAIKHDVAGIADFIKCGVFLQCPLVKNKTYSVCNWRPKPEKLPPLIPNGDYMVEIQATYRSTEFFVLQIYATIFRPIAD